jgi:hypothetical protein
VMATATFALLVLIGIHWYSNRDVWKMSIRCLANHIRLGFPATFDDQRVISFASHY